jgi:hypothetical protein
MSTSKRCLVTFFHSLRTHPQILKDLSKSHDQTVKTQGFFFWPFHAPPALGAWVKSRQSSHNNNTQKFKVHQTDFLGLSAADDRDAHTRKAVFLLKKLES